MLSSVKVSVLASFSNLKRLDGKQKLNLVILQDFLFHILWEAKAICSTITQNNYFSIFLSVCPHEPHKYKIECGRFLHFLCIIAIGLLELIMGSGLSPDTKFNLKSSQFRVWFAKIYLIRGIIKTDQMQTNFDHFCYIKIKSFMTWMQKYEKYRFLFRKFVNLWQIEKNHSKYLW